MFEIITWLVTNKCGLGCNYCQFTNRNNDVTPEDNLKALDVLKSLPESEKRFSVLLGGDILYYKDRFNFISKMNELNLPYAFQTCAHDYKRMEEILPIISNLSISFDGDSRERDRYLKMIKGIYWAGRARQLNPNMDIHATITIDSVTLHNVVETVKILSDLNIWAEITFSHYQKGTFDLVPDSKYIPHNYLSSSLKEVSQNLVNMKKQGYMIHNSIRFLESFPMYVKELNWKCKGPTSLVIDADLSLRMCLHLKGKRIAKWNVFDLVKKGWESTLIDYRMDWYEDFKELCPGCFWDCAYDLENSMSMDQAIDFVMHKG